MNGAGLAGLREEPRMSRAIDHLVIAAHDLDGQAALYRRLGFQVGARNRHPWGTENHIVQFDGAFLELIGLGPDFVAPSPAAAVHPFAGFLADYLDAPRGDGDAGSALDRCGSGPTALPGGGDWRFRPLRFCAQRGGPDGSEVEVAFSLAFAASPAVPEAGFFACQQHFPENFWSRAAQVHPNGARAIAGVVIANQRPHDHVEFLTRFVGASAARTMSGGFAFEAGGAVVEVMTPETIQDRYGDEVSAPNGPPLAVLRIGVDDVARTREHLAQGGTPFAGDDQALKVAARDGLGVGVVFERHRASL